MLTWNSTDLDAYLAEAGRLVRDVDGLLACIKGTVGQAQGILQQWQRDVMFERKEGRVSRHEELSGAMRDLILTRHAAVTGAECWLLRAGQRFAGPADCCACCPCIRSPAAAAAAPHVEHLLALPVQTAARRLPTTWRPSPARSRSTKAPQPGAGASAACLQCLLCWGP